MIEETGYIVKLKDTTKGVKALHKTASQYGTNIAMTVIEGATIFLNDYEAEVARDQYLKNKKTVYKSDLDIVQIKRIIFVEEITKQLK